MIKKTTLFLVFCSFGAWSSYSAAADGNGPKWCQEATVTGIIKKVPFKHSINGSEQVAFFVALEQPLNIAAGEGACVDMDKLTVKEIQVMTDEDMSKFIGKSVKVSGSLGVPETAYHIGDALLFPLVAVKAE